MLCFQNNAKNLRLPSLLFTRLLPKENLREPFGLPKQKIKSPSHIYRSQELIKGSTLRTGPPSPPPKKCYCVTSVKLLAAPFWDGCCDMGGPVTELEKELTGCFTVGRPLPLGCACPASFSSCNSWVSLSRWRSVAVLAAIGLLGVGSTGWQVKLILLTLMMTQLNSSFQHRIITALKFLIIVHLT